jgi:trk system potassium uptake protein
MKTRSFLIIGAGRFGEAVATTLFQSGHEVVVVDADEAAVQRVMASVTHALIADGTDERALRDLGAANFDAVVVAIGNRLEASVLATAAAKDAGARRIVAKAPTSVAERILRRVGADEVVRPERDMGVRLAQHLVTPSLVDRDGQLIVSPGAEVEVLEGDRLVLVGSNEATARLRDHLAG